MSTDVALHTAPKWPRAVNLEALGCRDSGAGDTLNNADRIVGDLGGVHTRGGGGEGSGVSKTKNERAANVMGGDRSASYKKKPMTPATIGVIYQEVLYLTIFFYLRGFLNHCIRGNAQPSYRRNYPPTV